MISVLVEICVKGVLMSKINYIASDTSLRIRPQPQVEYISVYEALDLRLSNIPEYKQNPCTNPVIQHSYVITRE